MEPGDVLVSINDKEILDVFDYRYMINDEYLEIVMKKTETVRKYIAEVEKDYDEDIGIVFESGLMDNARSCRNKCISALSTSFPKEGEKRCILKTMIQDFRFYRELCYPPTNMKDKDIDRIIYYHLSPINISVHTTNPELRKMMLNNNKAGNIMERMKKTGGCRNRTSFAGGALQRNKRRRRT